MSRVTPRAPAAPPATAARGAPPWRALVILVAVVVTAHTLVLQTTPSRFGLPLEAADSRTEAFQTRRIEAPPAAGPAVPPPEPAAARAPKSKPKKAEAQTERAQEAIDLIADSAPQKPASEASVSEPAVAQAAAPPDSSASAPASAALPPASAAGAASPVTAMALPASIRLVYKVTGFAKGLTYYADGELGWTNAGNSYDARMTVSALFIGSRSLSSRGSVSADGLAPSRFADKGRAEVAAHFDADQGQVTFSANTPPVPWVKGIQDRVSVFMQLGGMLAGNPAGFAPGSLISMYTVGPRDADTWTFRVDAEETMTLPFGEIRAIRLTRQPRREFDQQVEIWYAPALGYLPVRSKITQHGGDFVDQQLSAVGRV